MEQIEKSIYWFAKTVASLTNECLYCFSDFNRHKWLLSFFTLSEGKLTLELDIRCHIFVRNYTTILTLILMVARQYTLN